MLLGKKKKINAYLARKNGVFSTFDCVLSDYLSGNLKTQLAQMGLSKIEIYIDWLAELKMLNVQGVYKKYYVDVQLDAEELAIGIDEDEPDCNAFFTYNKEGDASVVYNLIKEALIGQSG